MATIPQLQTVLTPDESAQMEKIIADIESEGSPIATDCLPRHKGNFCFSFDNVPLGLFVAIMNASEGSLMRKFLRLPFCCRD